MDRSIVIPWRTCNDGWRDKSFKYILDHMKSYNPIVVDDGTEPFSRSGSKNIGARLCTSDVVLFLDADTYISHNQIDDAIDLARDGYVVYPYSDYHFITKSGTKKIVSGWDEPSIEHSELSTDSATGGAIAMLTDIFFSVGSFDEGFVDWGYEDTALDFMVKKNKIEIKRIEGNCYHLWHPRPLANDNVRANVERYNSIYLENSEFEEWKNTIDYGGII